MECHIGGAPNVGVFWLDPGKEKRVALDDNGAVVSTSTVWVNLTYTENALAPAIAGTLDEPVLEYTWPFDHNYQTPTVNTHTSPIHFVQNGTEALMAKVTGIMDHGTLLCSRIHPAYLFVPDLISDRFRPSFALIGAPLRSKNVADEASSYCIEGSIQQAAEDWKSLGASVSVTGDTLIHHTVVGVCNHYDPPEEIGDAPLCTPGSEGEKPIDEVYHLCGPL